MAGQDIPHSCPIVTRAEAKAAGLKRYFTGQPCKRGHVAEHWVTGPCVECQRINVNRWHANNKAKVNAGARQRHATNPERLRAKKRKWRAENLDRSRASDRKFRLRHPEKRAASTAAAKAKKPDLYCATRKNWAVKNADKLRASRKKWEQNNPVLLELSHEKWRVKNPDKLRAARARRRSRVRNAVGSYTATDVRIQHELQNGVCIYCHAKLHKDYHVDHKIALARGGSNWPDNIQLCCPTCNRRKSARDHAEFAKSIYEKINAAKTGRIKR